eukprot:c22779_g2_i1 orf=339-3224(-)
MAQSRGSRSRSSGMGKSVALTQFMLIELKQRILAALSKLADRDTQHIAVEELEHIAESLSPEGLSVCLSCLYDIDLRQKSAVIKERMKMLGTLATLHGNLLTVHLPKIVANVVRRLRDSDSSIRDACVETMGTLASKVAPPALSVGAYGGAENGVAAAFAGPLGVFFKPLFDALNEQNRGVQVGAAMCLARVIESANNPHPAALQRLCPRIVKYLNSPNFSAKPALLSVIASIAQAGGAASHQCLATLVLCVQEALKSTDWATRKAASETFASMASSIGSSLSSFKDSALDALESCRFDKVKPVRDSVVVTLQVWKDIPTIEMLVPARIPSVKENTFTEDRACHLQAIKVNTGREEAAVLKSLASVNSSNQQLENHCVFGQARSASNKISGSIYKKRTPLSDKHGNPDFFRKIENKDSNNWQVEVAVPYTSVSVTQNGSLESDLSGPQSATFGRERSIFQDCNGFRSTSVNGDVVNLHERNGSVKTEPVDGHQSVGIMIQNQIFEETVGMHSANGRRPRPKLVKVESQLDPVLQQHGECGSGCLTVGSCAPTPRNCSTIGKVASGNYDLALIHRQLCQIEEQQSNLLKLLQEFANSSQESLHGLDARVRGMENVVDTLARDIASVKCESGAPRCCGKLLAGADYLSSKFWKRNERGGSCNYRPVPSKAVASAARSGQESSVTIEAGAERCHEHRYGAAAQTGGHCLETEANTWRVHVDVSSKNVQGQANSDLGGHFSSLKKGCDRAKGFSRLGEGITARSVWQGSKDDVALAERQVTGGNSGVKVADSVKTSGGLSQSSSDTWSEGQNIKARGLGKGLFWSVWTRTVEFLRSGDVDSAYIEVLCAGDELLLVRLMSRTGPVLEQLSSGTAMELLGTAIQLLLQQSFLDIIIPWIQQVADLAGGSIPECLGLSLDAKREMVASLRKASALEFLEPWVGKTLDELALRLTNIWGMAFQNNSVA